MLRSRSRFFANVLRKEGDSRLELEKRVLQVREVENEAVRAMGGVSFNTLMPGALFAAGGLLFITRLNGHASRFVGGKFSPLSRREEAATPVLVMADMDVAEQNRGLLWIDEAIMYKEYLQFDLLKGMTLTSAVHDEADGGDVIHFKTSEGRTFELYHEQDCCESVSVEEIHGDLSDILDSEILLAEEVKSDREAKNPDWDDSFTWTFYKIRTQKGDVTIRWYGTSNGYYSESVSFRENLL